MAFYLGIDGGGTKTKVAIINDKNETVYIGEGGPSSIDTVDKITTRNNIDDALKDFYLKFEGAHFRSIFCGLGGIVSEDDMSNVRILLNSLKGVDPHTLITARNDMENALYSGACFDSGMTLICGTGMVAYAKNEAGLSAKAGGWGFKEGDQGSSYDLGMQALKHVAKAYDGRKERDAFSEEIAKEIGLNEASDIVQIMNTYYLERTWIASLSPLVTKHANLGNRYAKEMIDRGTSNLSDAVRSVYQKIKPENKTLVIVGSLGHSGGYFGKALYKKIREIDQMINIITPIYDPAVAAAMMAKRLFETK